MNKTLKTLLSALTIVALGLMVAPSAEAASIRLYNGTKTITINDFPEPVGDRLDGSPFLPGVVSNINILFGDWLLTITGGATKPTLGSNTLPKLDLAVIAVSFGGPSTLTVSFSEDSFGPSSLSASAYLAPRTTAGTVSYQTFQSLTNARFAEDTPLTSQGPFGPGGYGASSDSGTLASGAAPYSLTQKLTFTHTGAGTSTAFATLAVPDGGLTLSMLGFALLGVEGLRRKFRRV
jgi:VPDSG-CTERM motif